MDKDNLEMLLEIQRRFSHTTPEPKEHPVSVFLFSDAAVRCPTRLAGVALPFLAGVFVRRWSLRCCSAGRPPCLLLRDLRDLRPPAEEDPAIQLHSLSSTCSSTFTTNRTELNSMKSFPSWVSPDEVGIDFSIPANTSRIISQYQSLYCGQVELSGWATLVWQTSVIYKSFPCHSWVNALSIIFT